MEVHIDMAPDGTLYGIELLNANEQFTAEPAGKLVVVNAQQGKDTEIDLND